MNTEEFIKRSILRHGDRFDYTKSKYVSSRSHIIVTCKEHGDFTIAPYSHMNGTGCAKCSGKAKKTTASFIDEAKKINPTYDYSQVNYVTSKTPVIVKCGFGHEFAVIPNNLLRGSGCPICYGHCKDNTDNFIKKCEFVHKGKYDYTLVNYKSSQDKIRIRCPEHGIFEQIATLHKSGQGCPDCSGSKLKNTAKFIQDAISVHGSKYDYKDAIYINSKESVSIICNQHGTFKQIPNSHLRGAGCPHCSGNVLLTTETFIEKARLVHGDIYQYDKVSYGRNNRIPVTITCKKHGDFIQTPMDHLQGCGCSDCIEVVNTSAGESEVKDFIESLGVSCHKDRSVLDGKEIDIYIPSHKLAIEYNGLFWHSEQRIDKYAHRDKTILAESKGVRLIHIYEDDWLYKKDVVKNMLMNALGMSRNSVYARKCEVKHIENNIAAEFINLYHIQGETNSVSFSYGLYHDNLLIAVMQFAKSSSHRGKSVDTEYELIRYATSYKVVGGASKLFNHFLKTVCPKVVTSYSDNGMFIGSMYEKLGFHLSGKVPVDYKIIQNGARKHKSNFRKSKLAINYPDKYDSSLTEHENCLNLKLYRIYNSGLKKWVWKT